MNPAPAGQNLPLRMGGGPAPPPNHQQYGMPAGPAQGAPGVGAAARAPAPVAQGQGANPLNVSPDAPRILTGFLVSYEANALGQSWPIYQGTNMLGRLGAAAGADVELPHATVSSRHATIHALAHPGRMTFTDHGSTNGTFVNDSPLQAQLPNQLRDGDRVRLGLFNMIVKIV